MTTPANRAPRFLVLDKRGIEAAVYETEKEARRGASDRDIALTSYAPHTVHPIGAALPVAGKPPSRTEVTQEVLDAMNGVNQPRWAIRTKDGWWSGLARDGHKRTRATFFTSDCAHAAAKMVRGGWAVPTGIITKRRAR